MSDGKSQILRLREHVNRFRGMSEQFNGYDVCGNISKHFVLRFDFLQRPLYRIANHFVRII